MPDQHKQPINTGTRSTHTLALHSGLEIGGGDDACLSRLLPVERSFSTDCVDDDDAGNDDLLVQANSPRNGYDVNKSDAETI